MQPDHNSKGSSEATTINRVNGNQEPYSSNAPFDAAAELVQQVHEYPLDLDTTHTLNENASPSTDTFATQIHGVIIPKGKNGLPIDEHPAENPVDRDDHIASTGYHVQDKNVGSLFPADQPSPGLGYIDTDLETDGSMLGSGSEVDWDYFPSFEKATAVSPLDSNYNVHQHDTTHSPQESESAHGSIIKEDTYYPLQKTSSSQDETDVHKGDHVGTIPFSCNESAEQVKIQGCKRLLSQNRWKHRIIALQIVNKTTPHTHIASPLGLFHQLKVRFSSWASRLLLNLCYNPDGSRNVSSYNLFSFSITEVFISTCKNTIGAHDLCASAAMHVISQASKYTGYNCTYDVLTTFYAIEVAPFLADQSSLSTAAAASWCATHAFITDEGAALSSRVSSFPFQNTGINTTRPFNDQPISNSSSTYSAINDTNFWLVPPPSPLLLLTVCAISVLKRATDWFLDLVFYQLLPLLQYSLYRGVTMAASATLSGEYLNYIACESIERDTPPVISAVSSAPFSNYKTTLDGVLSPLSFMGDPETSPFTVLYTIWKTLFPYRCQHSNATNHVINIHDFYDDDDHHLPLYFIQISSTVFPVLLVTLIVVLVFQGLVHVRYSKYFKTIDNIKKAAEKERRENIEKKMEKKNEEQSGEMVQISIASRPL